MKQSPDYPSLARLAVIQHLRSYGIKMKHWNSKQRSESGKGSAATPHSGKIFGAPIHSLPHLFIPEYGNIPTFLADVCKYLESHAHTEGLFRKSGSVVRQKLLKTKLDGGDNDLSDAIPCDVAGILKQFFRELPEPILPADLQDVLSKAQQLGSDEDKASATILISSLMPERTVPILRYFFNFLQNVSMRSDTNRMDSSNLAVIFAPNLLQTGDSDKISASTEKKLRVQAAIVQTLIDQAADIGYVPNFLLEKIPGMLGMDVASDTPGAEQLEEGDADSDGERKRRRRRSVGDFVSGALNKLKTNRTPTSTPQTDRTVFSSMVTPLILTPSTKRKLPLDSVQGISNKKRKSIKQNLTFELLPSTLFGGGSTPSSARTEGSPCVSFEISENCFSPSVSGSKHLTSTSNLRRSKRVESGKTGCFSPKISRKEMVRRSLRLRFSLGKSSKEVNSGNPTSVRSQNIGWRLANSQELPTPGNKLEAHSSVESPFVSAGSKKISKSEDNLLTPRKSDDLSHRMSWTGPPPLSKVCDDGTPLSGYLYAGNCYSEPVLVTGKPPAIPKENKSVTDNSSKENNHREDSLCVDEDYQAQKTVRRITQAFTESGSDLSAFVGCSKSSAQELLAFISEPQTKSETSVIGSVVEQKTCTSEPQTECDTLFRSNKDCDGVANETSSKTNYKEQTVVKKHLASREAPVENLVVNAHQDSPQILLKIVEDGDADSTGLTEVSQRKLKCDMNVFESRRGNSLIKSDFSVSQKVVGLLKSEKNLSNAIPNQENFSRVSQDIRSVPAPVRKSSRVSDHIMHFNRLCLNDGSVQKFKSPIKLQRTPVRQSVRRINSLSEFKRDVDNLREAERMASSPMVKSVSCDGSLSSELSLTHSSHRHYSAGCKENATSCEHLSTVSFRGVSSRFSQQTFANAPTSVPSSVNQVKSVLEDLTNQDITKSTSTKSDLSLNVPNNAVRVLSNRQHNRYRGSPKNPIGKVTFLPASKPLDL
ncbi:rho GTPase-activating protein 11A-like isoform X2 [Rana temporaria]|uniref:rho GTPase-activating protein 11A-like isoform X2 n=1 Tax=Rana temporaria TaxID=8407 RepID=UPI001AAD06C3|nr:rho GTPase-activating protein 11A-like isoform X2 [Rana temporaria]